MRTTALVIIGSSSTARIRSGGSAPPGPAESGDGSAGTDVSTRRERRAERRPGAGRRGHLDAPAMLVDDPEHHRQTQTSATLALGGEERLEYPSPDLGTHAHARIDDFDDALPILGDHAQADRAAHRQRIDGVEDEIGHQLAELRRGALDRRVAGRLDVQTDRPALGLRGIAPARRGQLGRVAYHGTEIDAFAVQLWRRPRKTGAAV